MTESVGIGESSGSCAGDVKSACNDLGDRKCCGVFKIMWTSARRKAHRRTTWGWIQKTSDRSEHCTRAEREECGGMSHHHGFA